MPRLRVTVGGPIATTGKWSNTFEFLLSASIASQAALQGVMNAVYTALAASTPYKTAIMSDSSTVNIKGLHYPTNTGASDLVATSAGAGFPGVGTAVHAPQVCVVASLRTSLAGRSYRGRVYVPFRGSTISAAGVVSSGTQTVIDNYVNAVVGAVATALTAISVSASWVVWSPTKGTGSPITAVLVGGQCDTIRHRNANRTEAYASFAAPTLTLDALDEADLERIQAVAVQTIKTLNNTPAQGLGETLGIIGGAVIAG